MDKRKTAFLLSFLMLLNILLSSMPISYADTLSAETINDIQKLGAYQRDIFAKDLLINSSISIDDIETYLTEYGIKYPLWSDNLEYRLNPYVYKKYKVVAYTSEEAYNAGIAGFINVGSPKKETQSISLSDGGIKVESVDEYRYLGYKVTGEDIITNDFFPADYKSSVDMRDKSWVMNDPKVRSWNENVLEDPNALYYYLKTNVLNDENFFGFFERTDYSIADLVDSNEYDTLTRYPKVMSDVSFSNPLVLNMVHRSGGTLWYDTMRLKQYSYDLDTKIDNVLVDVKLPVGTESYDIYYDVTSLITNIKTDTLSKDGKYFAYVGIDSNGREFPIYNNDTTVNQELPLLKESITRKVDLTGAKVGEPKAVTLNAKSIVTTFDDGVRTDEAVPVVVKITLVAEDTVDFIIKRNETDVTDGTVTVENIANPNLPLTLNDTSFVESGDITSYVYKVVTPTGEKTVSGGANPIASYTITGANKDCIIDGKVTFIEYVYTASGLVDSVKHIVNVKEESAPIGGSGVVAILTSSADFNERKDYYEVMEGERFTLRGNKSYHEAGLKLTDYSFDVGEEFDEGIIYRSSKKNVGAFYPNSDGGSVYKAYLDVTAEDGSTGDDKIRTKVYPAKFDPEIEVYGSFKENRKLSFFVDNTHNLTYYPIDESSLLWTITPLDGQGDVVRVDGSLKGSQSFDALFKKKGSYKIRVEGQIESPYNTNRYSGSAEKIINIAEDLPPKADLIVEKRKPRDVENGLMTKLYLYDNSDSLDDDIIVQRIMSYKFDSDNDGDFDDETSVIFHAGNEKEFYILTDHVGNYQFDIKVKEEFGQETISRFITDADKKRGDTSNKDFSDKTTELYNVAPTVELEVSQKKKVNVIVYDDLDSNENLKVNTMLKEIETGLIEKKIDLDVHRIKPTETVGSREVWTTYFDSYINVKVHVVGEDEDRDEIDYVQEMRFLLDSFTSEGNEDDVKDIDANRFEFVGVRWGNSYSQKFKYKNRKKDYTDYSWKELIVTYKENGVEKEKLYNFVYEYEKLDLEGNSNRHDEFDYDEYDIVGTELVVDQPSTDRESFVVENNTFRYGASYRPKQNLPRNTKRSVALKKYSDEELEDILNECGENDTIFINLASKEENRLALNETLIEQLKTRNIPYLTLDDFKLRINPLTGRFDELFQGDKIGRNWVGHWSYYSYYINRMIVSIGDLAYEIDEENQRYMFMGLASRYRDEYVYSVENEHMVKSTSIYTSGYNYKDRYGRDRVAYGETALRERCYDMDEVDVRDTWEWWEDDRREKGLPYDWRTFITTHFDDTWYRQYLQMLGVEEDGSIWGYYLEYDRYNDEFEYKYKRVASGGYKGTINLNLKTSQGFNIVGYVHNNGNIYFKDMAISGGNFTPYDYLVVTEGTDNIRLMKATNDGAALFVYTDTQVVKYDFKGRKRTGLSSDYLNRKGTSVKIGENKWMIGDVIYDGYKEIYTNDLTGTDAIARYEYKDRPQSVHATSKYKYYIDLDGNLYEDKYWYCESRGTVYQHDNHTLIDTDVVSLPFMQYLSEFPKPDTLSGGFDNYWGRRWNNNAEDEYEARAHYIKDDGYLYSKNGDKRFNSPIKNIQSVGVASYRNSYGNYLKYWPALISLVDGTFGYSQSFENIKTIRYATLTSGAYGEVVGDNQLVALNELSKSLNSYSEIKDYILEIYEDYTSSDTMTILLNDLVNTSMVMFDREDDPAYEGGMVINTEHINPNYYENSLGKDPGAGEGIRLDQFKYVGHYLMEARVRDNPVGDDDRFDNYRLWNKDNTQVNVYVHRRPVAKMDYVLSEKDDHYILRAWDKDSYDLDHESEVNNGIVAWQWSIKEKDEITWTQYQSKEIVYDKIKSGTTYDVIFKVKDKEGVWSEPVRKEINPEIIPIELDASVRTLDDRFRVDQLPITEYYEVYDLITRYPTPVNLSYGLYDGDTLLTPLETLTQDEGVTGYFKTEEDRKLDQFTWYNRTLKVPKTLADGAYTIVIKASAVNNASKSETCRLDVGVRTPIHPVPSIEDLWMTGESYELSCRTSIYTDEVMVSVFNGSPKEKTLTMTLDEIMSEEIGGQIKQTEKVWKATCAVPEDLVDGMYDLVFTGRVLTTPSKSEQAIASVQVISLKFDEVILTGAWNHWRGQIDLFGKRMDDMPLRFLSWEKVYFTAKTLGNPEKVYISLSPELEAMSFTDKNGTVFKYKDDFGYEVEFPLALKEIEDNVWTGEYILPLAHSTLSWEDQRLKPAYEIIVTAEKNGKRVTYEFTEEEDRGIEITGNVTNLIYEQPMPDRSR